MTDSRAGGEAQEPDTPTSQVSPGVGGAPAMSFCRDCGERLDATADFCPQCGRPKQGDVTQPLAAGPSITAASESPGAFDDSPMSTSPLQHEVAHTSSVPTPPLESVHTAARARKVLGMPPWLAGALVAFIIVGGTLAAILVLFVGGGGENGDKAYLANIKVAFNLLSRSSNTAGDVLATVANPGDVTVLGRQAVSQLAAVNEARGLFAKVQVAPAQRAAHNELLRAVDEHRHLLGLLVRATATPPDKALAELGALDASAQQMLGHYRAFFRLEPQALDTITGAGLSDFSGLRTALRAKADVSPGGTANRGGSPTGPSLGDAGGFTTPTGNTVCSASGGSVLCQSGSNAIGLDQTGLAYAVGSAQRGHRRLDYGQPWSLGEIHCSVDQFAGTTCSNNSFAGFTIRLQDVKTF